MPFSGSSAHMFVVGLLVFCALMVVYGMWKIIRGMSRMRGQDIDGSKITEIYDLFKEELEQKNAQEDKTSEEILAEFYALQKPTDSRFLN